MYIHHGTSSSRHPHSSQGIGTKNLDHRLAPPANCLSDLLELFLARFSRGFLRLRPSRMQRLPLAILGTAPTPRRPLVFRHVRRTQRAHFVVGAQPPFFWPTRLHRAAVARSAAAPTPIICFARLAEYFIIQLLNITLLSRTILAPPFHPGASAAPRGSRKDSSTSRTTYPLL
jgi:hypothetical protein